MIKDRLCNVAESSASSRQAGQRLGLLSVLGGILPRPVAEEVRRISSLGIRLRNRAVPAGGAAVIAKTFGDEVEDLWR